jgi:hypothetical protein
VASSVRDGDKDKRLLVVATVLAVIAIGLTMCAPDLARWFSAS